MSVDKRVNYDVQGGVKNYLGKQKEVKAHLKCLSSPDHPTTEKVDTRARARAIALTISNTAVDTSWKLGTFRLDIQVGGRR